MEEVQAGKEGNQSNDGNESFGCDIFWYNRKVYKIVRKQKTEEYYHINRDYWPKSFPTFLYLITLIPPLFVQMAFYGLTNWDW